MNGKGRYALEINEGAEVEGRDVESCKISC